MKTVTLTKPKRNQTGWAF